MQPDKAAAVKGWLCRAANDLRGAHIDIEADPPLAVGRFYSGTSRLWHRTGFSH